MGLETIDNVEEIATVVLLNVVVELGRAVVERIVICSVLPNTFRADRGKEVVLALAVTLEEQRTRMATTKVAKERNCICICMNAMAIAGSL